MITINKGQCIGCLKCVSVCPFTVLGTAEGKPYLREDKACLKCMHCAAACPQNAISYGDQDAVLPQQVQPLPENFSELLERHILTRRSYRHFKNEPVDRDLIGHALELASWAPSAKNQHPAKWMVLDSPDVIKKIMDQIIQYVKDTGLSPEIASEYEEEGNNVVMGNAPTLILCYGRENAINSPTDTAIAITTAELFLQAQGVGTCWAGYLTRLCNAIPQIQKLLPAIPEGNRFYGALMAGYPYNETYYYVPERLKRADIKWV